MNFGDADEICQAQNTGGKIMKRSMIRRAGKGLAALLLAVAVSTGVLPASAEAAEMSDFKAIFDAYSTGSGVNADMFGWQDIEKSTLSAHWGVNTDGCWRALAAAISSFCTQKKLTLIFR